MALPEVLFRQPQRIDGLGAEKEDRHSLGLDDRLPHLALNRHHRIDGERHAALGIKVQHRLPQTDAPGSQQLGVGDAAIDLSPQHKVNQSLVLAH